MLFFLLLLGCESNSGSSNVMDQIRKNKIKWESSGLSSYTYIYSNYPTDCPAMDVYPPVVITVVNNTVSSVYVPEFGAYEESLLGWPTITKLFETMVVDASDNPTVFSKNRIEINKEPEFDELYGYPVSYYFDKSNKECDAFSVRISEFHSI